MRWMMDAADQGGSVRVEDLEFRGQGAPTAHLFFGGQGYDFSLRDLDVGPRSPDAQVRAAVSQAASVPLEKLHHHQVRWNEATGDVTLEPPAVFG
jgi:hypothetical protein